MFILFECCLLLLQCTSYYGFQRYKPFFFDEVDFFWRIKHYYEKITQHERSYYLLGQFG